MRKIIAVAFLCIAVSTALVAGQPSGGDFVISNSTIDNGGGVSSGGEFTLKVDPNRYLPDRQINPNAGRLYVESKNNSIN